MLIALLPLASAHSTAAPHVHWAPSLGMFVLATWVGLALVWWRRAAA